jgi:hypothetical protein
LEDFFETSPESREFHDPREFVREVVFSQIMNRECVEVHPVTEITDITTSSIWLEPNNSKDDEGDEEVPVVEA